MEWNNNQQKLLRRLKNKWAFRFFTKKMVPAAAHAKVRFVSLDGDKCEILIPYCRQNKNPFRSMYFAVQSMAAEMSTALLAMLYLEGYEESVAWIVLDFRVEFPSKATGDVVFTCLDGNVVRQAVEKAILTGVPQVATLTSVGRMRNGTVVSEFTFNWSFKKRSLH